LAYLSIANSVVIATLRDGLNLVPFELLATVENKKVPIILSEFAGVSRALNSPVRVNPYSLDSLEAAMVNAIFDYDIS